MRLLLAWLKAVVQPRDDSSKFGSDAHHELIAHALDKAEEAAIAVAPYLEPKLAAKTVDRGEGSINIVLDAINLAN
jgi:hypothetical protein